MAVNEVLERRTFERRFFLFAAIAFAAITFIGFARTYYLVPVIGGAPLRWVAHVHGVLMTLWVLLFGAQVFLIRTKRVQTHMRMGWAAVGLAVAILPAGFLTAIYATKYGNSPSTPPDIPPLSFMLIPMADLVMFVIFFSAAIYFRKSPAEHKRLMLLTALNFLPPAVARIPIPELQAFGPLWFFGFPALLFIAAIVIDTKRTGRLNRVFLIGGVLWIVAMFGRLPLSESGAWLGVAEWLVTVF